jgi:cell division protein FtsA
MAQGPRIVAALDVGNHRVLALIAELSERDEMVIRGVGLAPSNGMRSGQVVQMKPVVAAIKAAAEEAELMAKLPVEKVIASVAGIFVSGRLTRAAIAMGAREREVMLADLEALHEAVRRQPLPTGHTVLNVISPTYALDDQEGILDPQSMVGRHLAARSARSRRRSTRPGSKSRSSSSRRWPLPTPRLPRTSGGSARC